MALHSSVGFTQKHNGSLGSQFSANGGRHTQRTARICSTPRAQQSDPIRNMFRSIKSALPVVGLISRLTAAEGGSVTDRLEYPEFSRSVYEAAPTNFQIAVADLQTTYGKRAQRKYILFCLWMTKFGVGVIPAKSIVDSSRRLAVSQDLEFEMDRFNQAVAEVLKDLRFIEPAKATPQATADVAVDSICRLVGIKDGETLEPSTADMVAGAALGGFWNDPGYEEHVARSIATRAERRSAYV